MARNPKPPLRVVHPIWTALSDWPPVQAACTFAGHIGVGVVCMGAVWLSEVAYHLIFSTDPTYFGWIPVKWFFQASEVGILGIFVLSSICDAWRKLMW